MAFFENFTIFLFVFITLFLFIILLILNLIFAPQSIYIEKITSYECGFQTFEYFINNYDIKYYLIAILFLIFDLELVFFLPWLLSLTYVINLLSIIFFLIFYIILILGFFYEWKTDSLSFLDYQDI